MANDIARLGIQVDSTQAAQASGDLDSLSASAVRAQKATDSLSGSSTGATAALRGMGTVSGATAKAAEELRKAVASGGAVTSAQIQAVGGWVAAQKIIQEAMASTARAEEIKTTTIISGERAAATAAVESAVIQRAANDHIRGSSTALRETLTLLREASVGNYTRMAGSASILLQALGLLEAVLIPLAAAAVVVGGSIALANNQINSGVKGTGDLTRGLGLTEEQLERVQNRYVSFGDTLKAVGQVIWSDIGDPKIMEAVQKTWNAIADFIYESMVIVDGAVQGGVNVIVEAWKAMPKFLGGEGTTAGIDFARAFQKGIDDTRAELDAFFNDVAGQARKNALDRIREEAGKAPKSSDHQIDSAEKQLADARNQLAAQKALNDAVQTYIVSYQEMVKQESIDSNLKSIIAQRDADLAKGTAESIKQAQELTRIIGQLQPVYAALYDQKLVAQQIATNEQLFQQNILLEKQIELAGQLVDKREMELALFRTRRDLELNGIPEDSHLGQATLSTMADNIRREQGLKRSEVLNAIPDSGTRLATNAASSVLAEGPERLVKQQQAAYSEIDKMRQQDVLNEQQAARAKAKVDADILTERLSNTRDFFSNLSSLSSSSNKTISGIGKAAAIAQATIDGILAVQKALASAPPPWNYALAASVGAVTAANVAAIEAQGYATGVVGLNGPGTGTSDSIPAWLSNGESVITARGTRGNENTLKAMNEGAKFDGGFGGGMRVEVIHDGSTGVRVQQVSPNQVRIIARQEIQAAAPAIVGAAGGQVRDKLAVASQNPRKRGAR